ncbi:hypothetical protein PsorP6_004878 [Peronosclerospora sorghi]|uniref:Uncharacterized protein n=1 Tax=Peronosclerospora sorghi TaxID=230839 RepID=A0ACC0W633_9STRA|nr:hypothetical protein PsorP6_004878 [Peronosclerospora sorghi]
MIKRNHAEDVFVSFELRDHVVVQLKIAWQLEEKATSTQQNVKWYKNDVILTGGETYLSKKIGNLCIQSHSFDQTTARKLPIRSRRMLLPTALSIRKRKKPGQASAFQQLFE